jgi:protein TonB
LIAVDQVLERRQGLSRSRRGRLATFFSVSLHLLLGAGAIFGSLWTAKATPVLPFIQAEIVPLQALGLPDPPRPSPKAPVVPPPPTVQPEPEPPPSVPVKKEEEAPRPVPVDAPLPTRQAPTQPAKTVVQEPTPAPKQPEPLPTREGSETGNVRGQSSFGAAVASLDNPDFTYGYYLDRMVALIRSRWTRPAVAVGTRTTLHFVISKNGAIGELEIRQPSGIPVFDQTAVRAVSEASPLPPLPVGYRHDTLGVTLIVE